MQALIQRIESLINGLDEAEVDAFQAVTDIKKFKRGEFLLRFEAVCTQCFWVEQGVLRKFYVHQERDITTEFYSKDDLAISFESYTLQKPSRESIQALTDSTVRIIDLYEFQKRKSMHPKLAELDLMLTEYYALSLEEKVFELQTQNATQRYEKLLAKSPQIIQQVAVTQLAAYLHVSLETLSRIRAKR